MFSAKLILPFYRGGIRKATDLSGKKEVNMLKYFIIPIITAYIGLTSACQTYHQVALEPVEIKPIHITIDVNVKVDKALDDFFGDIDKAADKEKSNSSKK